MARTLAIAAVVLLLFSCLANAQISSKPSTDKPHANPSERVTITFAKSPYADFLFYLLYRNSGPFPDLATVVPMTENKPLEGSSFLPEDAIVSGVSNYNALYELASHHDDPRRLSEMLKQAEPRYPAFYSFWQQHIGPAEDKTAQAWAKENEQWDPVKHLEEMERLKFPFSNIQIDLLALDPQGSSMQGPPTIFTTLEVPSLAWAIGHEGTHMMIGPAGANWRTRQNGDQAAQLMKENGGSDYDVEEALCLLMQAKMSIAFGATPADFISSDKLKTSPRKTLLVALENDWADYSKLANLNAADWLISETLKTFSKDSSAR
jgi:hypothetical protein